MKALMLVLLMVVMSWPVCHSSKMLFVAPIGTKSQISFLGEIIKPLVDRGHQVTFLTSYPGPRHPNVTEIDAKVPVLKYMPNIFQNRDRATLNKLDLIIPKLCLKSLQQKSVEDLNMDDFDVVFLLAIRNGNDCFLLRLHDKQVPLILVTPVQLDLHLHETIGNVDFPSFVTALGQTNWHQMTFWQRIQNMVATFQVYKDTKFEFIPRIEMMCRENGMCPNDMTSLEEVSRRSSFVFVNSVRSLESPPRPHVPGVVHLGCLKCRDPLPLSEELESWVKGAGDAGFIYMSLGTVVNPSEMADRSRLILLKVFSELKQRVLWKWDAPPVENLPDNVKMVQWAPQQDILGHPKLRFFMTQGGVFSTGEAAHYGVPLLGMPVFFDQNTNINKIVQEGWGEAIEWEELTEQFLMDQIQKLLNNESYRATAQKRSMLVRDQPMTPHETVTYWTEYTIRHKGAQHLMSPVRDLPWYKLYNADIWSALVLATFLCFLLLTRLILAGSRLVLRLFKSPNRSPKARKEKIRKEKIRKD